MGKLNVRVGAMASIKTTELVTVVYNYEEQECVGVPIVVKPQIDTKGEHRIVSRTGIGRDSDIQLQRTQSLLTEVNTLVLKRTIERPTAQQDDTLVVIDEAQFITAEQAEEAHAFALARPDNAVIAAGIRLDAMGHGFTGMARLMELAHDIQIRDTWCRCKHKAFYNTRKVDGVFTFSGSQVAIDGEGAVSYQSLCRNCYKDEVEKALQAGSEINATTLAILGLNTATKSRLYENTTDKPAKPNYNKQQAEGK